MTVEKTPAIVNFAAIDYWYHNRAHSEIQLTTRLSKSTKVLFINSIGMRAPIPGRTSNSGFRIWRKVKSMFKGLRRPIKEFPNFYVFSPLIVPAYSTPWLRSVNYMMITVQVRIAMLILRIKKPLVIETIPTANKIAPRLKPILEIVNRVDKMSAFGETDRAYISSQEEAQIKRAARTYYTSRLLLEDEKSWHENKGRFLDHGVDLNLFKPLSVHTKKPTEIQHIETPILGFFGGIDDYVIDIGLLEKISEEFSNNKIVLIGEATCDISRITKHENVLYLGFCGIKDVARIGAFFDVALLPRRNDEWTRYTNPIKIKEYLALGLEIVTMDIPEVRRYENDISIVSNHDEFIQAIHKSLGTESTQPRKLHLASLVDQDTWDNRCNEVLADMKELLSCVE